MIRVVNNLAAPVSRDVLVCDRGWGLLQLKKPSSPTGTRFPNLSLPASPVVFDATHSAQQPGGQGATSCGQRQFVSVLALAT
jgi:2-dehydro-3-deoxyphosphooctonate aldolase (KDO 8-P synthase)